VSGIVGSIRQAIPIAEDAIDSGKVMVKFNQFRTFTSEFYRQNYGGTSSEKKISPSTISISSHTLGERI
jgi:anthranilate phosphoribosyltransferase